ncbi:MAG: hypothetical protein JWQ76_5392 [Ramlibacter sp.]|nr:hypothetical protein [Ramlibacter sp.]
MILFVLRKSASHSVQSSKRLLLHGRERILINF